MTLLVGGMSLYIMPWSFRELRDLVMKIRADFITHVVREGTFTTLDQGFIFHYRERGQRRRAAWNPYGGSARPESYLLLCGGERSDLVERRQ